MEFDDFITREKYEALCDAGHQLLDEVFDAAAEVWRTDSPEPLLTWLPEQFSHHYTRLFAKRFFVTCVSVVGALDEWNGAGAIVSCTADALALAALIETAKARIEINADAEGQQATEEDLDFTSFQSALFPDMDYQFLFEPQLDGIEDDEIADYHGMMLRFKDWFEPYAGPGRVHPYCRSE